MYEDIQARIAAFRTERDALQDSLKDFFTTDAPLTDRWSAFLAAGDVLDTETYGDGHVDVLGVDSPYDELNFERRETISYADLDERLVENFMDAEAVLAEPEKYPDAPYWKPVENAHKWITYKATYDQWREAVLKSGCGSFTYDW